MVDWKDRTPFYDYLSRLPVEESVLVQLEPGDLGLSSIDVRGRESFIVRFKTGARSIWTMVPEPQWVGFLVPISWAGEYLLNGMAAKPNSVFQLDGTQEYDTVTEQRDAVTVGVRRSVLASAAAALTGGEYQIRAPSQKKMDVPAKYRRHLISILSKAIAASPISASGDHFQSMPRTIETDMVSAIADWMIQMDDLDTYHLVANRSDLKIVRDAKDAIRQAGHANLSIADLCQAAGVNKSRLHQAFSEVQGVSPGDYLYRTRLTYSREFLLKSERVGQSVKDIAIKHGFLSSGQFARAYRSMFGELPSETMAR